MTTRCRRIHDRRICIGAAGAGRLAHCGGTIQSRRFPSQAKFLIPVARHGRRRWALLPRNSPMMLQPTMRSNRQVCDALPFSTTRCGSPMLQGGPLTPSIAVISISLPDRREGPTADPHSGSPAFRKPSANLARSSGRRRGNTSARFDTRNEGSSSRK